jgi:hypothetical protein
LREGVARRIYMGSQRDLFSLSVSRSAFDYSLISCGIHPQPGVELDITVIGQQPGDTYSYTLSHNPCLDVPSQVEAVEVTARTGQGVFLFYYPYEELLVSLRPEVQT